METQKQQLSGELYSQYQNRLTELNDALTNQLYIISNIDELTTALSRSIANSTDQNKVNTWKQQVEYLTTLK